MGTRGTGEGRGSKETWGWKAQLLDVKLHDTQARYLPPHPLTQTPFSPQESGAGDEANGPQGERETRPQGSAPPVMPQSRSSESARVATLPPRGPELSAQEQMEGMLCRKQEMEAFGKKAANRYWVWPRSACGLSSPCLLKRLAWNLFLDRGGRGALHEGCPLGKG